MPLPGAEWRDLRRLPLWLALGIALLAFALAYQWPGGASTTIDVGAQGDRSYLSNFYAQERSTDPANPFDYRWAQPVAFVTIPGVGRNVPLTVTLHVVGRPEGAPPTNLTVRAGAETVADFEPEGYPPRPYTVTVPPAANTADDLVLTLQSDAYSPPGERRELGVLVDSIEVAQPPGQLAIPPPSTLGWLLLSLLLVHFTLSHVRVPARPAALATLTAGLLAAAALALARYDLTIFVEEFTVVTFSTYLLALLMPPLVEWTLRRLRVPPSLPDLRALMLVFLAAFAVKAGGMLHPQFVDLDHLFRVHQVQELVNNPAQFWDKYQRVTTADETGTVHEETEHSMLGQWNLVVPFPYSPIGYFVLAPLALIWPRGHEFELVTAVDTTLAALSSTLVFALYAMARRGLNSPRAGIAAAIVVSFAPITYLHFSDGAYPYIWAGWISVVYLMAAVLLAPVAARRGPFAVLTVLSALTFLSHTALVFFALAFVAAAAVIIWAIRRTRSGAAHTAGLHFLPLLWSFLAGAVLSLVYYGGYIVPILTVSIPALLQRGIGGGVGLDERYLGWKLLYGFGPQVQAHFTGWPIVLAAVGLIAAAFALWRTQTVPPSGPAPSSPPNPYRAVTFVFLAAWTVTFLAFSALDLRFNLLQRHMLFGLPLVALLSGYTIALLSRRGPSLPRVRPSHVMAGALLAYMLLVGLNLWVDRALRYVLPPGSG
jgi:hypothetical protein